MADPNLNATCDIGNNSPKHRYKEQGHNGFGATKGGKPGEEPERPKVREKGKQYLVEPGTNSLG